jgi:Flp pilus assembly pilin Flp
MLKTLTAAQVAMLARKRSNRGITFIEYAILAAIAVVIGLVFKEQLAGLFNTLFGNIESVVGSTTR